MWLLCCSLSARVDWPVTTSDLGKRRERAHYAPRPTTIVLVSFSGLYECACTSRFIHTWGPRLVCTSRTHACTHTRGPTIIRDDHRHRAAAQEVATVAHIFCAEIAAKSENPRFARPRTTASLSRRKERLVLSLERGKFVRRRWCNRDGAGKREIEFRFSPFFIKERMSIIRRATRCTS